MLILEDNAGRIMHFAQAYPEAVIVTRAKDAIKCLSERGWHHVSLDHDLNNEIFVDSARDDCGMEVVRWIVHHRPQIDFINIHTANRGASEKMHEALINAGYKCARAPFGGEYDPRS